MSQLVLRQQENFTGVFSASLYLSPVAIPRRGGFSIDYLSKFQKVFVSATIHEFSISEK